MMWVLPTWFKQISLISAFILVDLDSNNFFFIYVTDGGPCSFLILCLILAIKIPTALLFADILLDLGNQKALMILLFAVIALGSIPMRIHLTKQALV